jgi:hypothetical protein
MATPPMRPTTGSITSAARSRRGARDLGDETQEFRVVLGNADDWLEDEES